MNKELLQTTTPETLQKVREMITVARYSTLATIEPGTGHPAISRVAMAALANATPLLLTSALATHTRALAADKRCSLLIGEVGKGDPMAHARISIFCHAAKVPEDERASLRALFLAHHPKAINYIDLPDFGYWQLLVDRVSFNAGFGKAYAISGDELISG